MRIYLVVRSARLNLVRTEIISAHFTKTGAKRVVNDMKADDPYANQYLTVIPMNVRK